jgi:hypothetical protein
VAKRFPTGVRLALLGASLSLGLALLAARSASGPPAWHPDEVPVAFWSWRIEAPTNAEVARTFDATNAQTLFLRAGQIDLTGDKAPTRIRETRGTMPSKAPLHLVYNGTPQLLRGFEIVGIDLLSNSIVETFRRDSARAAGDGATVKGLQMDLDVPTRLLPRYAELLHRIRESLPPETQLSITGLPTWTASSDLSLVLENVDFWIPQFYGAGIPFRKGQKIPISSGAFVTAAVAKAADLGKPFYAGLSGYGYAILYSKEGDLLELRGDIDPASAARNRDLEQVETGRYERSSEASEVMYGYLAKGDVVLDGLVVHRGETLVFDQPTSSSLRAAAAAVRTKGGSALLGICLFRLPTHEDETTLTLAEIRSALDGSPPRISTALKLSSTGGTLTLEAKNAGNVSGLTGDGAFTVDLELPPGSFAGMSRLERFSSVETLCSNGAADPRPCSQRRANILRLSAKTWRPSDWAVATFNLSGPLPQSVRTAATTHTSESGFDHETFELIPNSNQ